MKPSEIVKKLNEDVVAINLASMFGGMPQSYQERATCYKAAADLIEGLIPRPIEEADTTKSVIYIRDDKTLGAFETLIDYNKEMSIIYCADWKDLQKSEGIKSFIPLSAIQALMESGK